ncbi:RecX family transcriptional regulator [uncultured Shewanella sp.]|uniref:RecX family transcriptional regulator n=1 Tax=uncultured Shewanella sp. TaxID=173975 RepID=UPI00262F69F1|nr:RecX family transcriptional regulator [uncultured Shewanella sp.]
MRAAITPAKSKLIFRRFGSAEIEEVLDLCEASGFPDDSRYGELLIRTHISKGLDKDINSLALDALDALDACDCDWYESAKQKAFKKYSASPIKANKDEVKRIRCLLGQGAYGQITYALDYDPRR